MELLNYSFIKSKWNLVVISISRLCIPIGTNCAPLLADLLLFSYEADFVQHLQKSKFNKQTKNTL